METRERSHDRKDHAGDARGHLRRGALSLASPQSLASPRRTGAACQAPGRALRTHYLPSPARKPRDRASGASRLTDRQQQVLALMAEGCSNAAIARKLFVTERAVIQHVSNIYDQLGLAVSIDDHRRVLAVLCYLDR